MARVEWTRIEPGDVEHVVAVMTRREHTSGHRVRPSRGDRGVDILVPVSTPQLVDVHQVKSFASNLTSSQKAQIEKSYDRFRSTVVARGLQVRTWYLVMPLDPTPENDDWFADLTKEAPFQCEWSGLDYVDGLASKYPEVIDYYLRDGKERLESAVAALASVIKLRSDVEAAGSPEGSIRPSDTVEGLAALHEELNRYDPHYRYDYSVDAIRPEVHASRGLVFATQIGDADRTITFRVFARFNEATYERPLPIHVTWNVEEGTDAAEALKDWIDFGTPFSAPPGSANLDLDLPGGLGGRVEGAATSVGPPADASGYDLRLYTFDPPGNELASALVNMRPITTGVSGAGVRAAGTEEHGVFDLEMRITLPDGPMAVNVSAVGDLNGKRPAEVLPGLTFLASLRAPNELRFGPPFGPANPSGMKIPPDSRPDDEDLVRETVEALDTIQGATQVQVFVPNLETLTRRQASGLIRAAHLLRGQSLIGTWKNYSVRVKPEARSRASSPMAVVLEESFAVMIGDVEVQLGVRRTQIAGAILEILDETPGDDGLLTARLVPTPGNENVTIRLVPPPSPN